MANDQNRENNNRKREIRINVFTLEPTCNIAFVIRANGTETLVDSRNMTGDGTECNDSIPINLCTRLQINRDNNNLELCKTLKGVGDVSMGYKDPDNTYYPQVPTGTFYDTIEMIQALFTLVIEHGNEATVPRYEPGKEFAILNGDDTNERGRYGDWAALYFAIYSAIYMGVTRSHIAIRLGKLWDHEALYHFKNPGYAFFIYSLVPELFDNYDGWKHYFRRTPNPYAAVTDMLEQAFSKEWVELVRTGDITLDDQTNCTSGTIPGKVVIGCPQATEDVYTTLNTEILRAKTGFAADICSLRGLPRNMIVQALDWFRQYNIIGEGLFEANDTGRARIRELQQLRQQTPFVVPLDRLGTIVYSPSEGSHIDCYETAIGQTICGEHVLEPGQPTMRPHADALLRLQEATNGVFLNTPSGRAFDWTGIFLAGGLPAQCINAVIDTIAPASDIDLFIYGDTPEARKATFDRLIATLTAPTVSNNLCNGEGVSETVFCINGSVCTVLHPKLSRPIQIICTDARTKTAILERFDLNACQVGFDGTDFLLTPAAIQAFVTRVAMVTNYDRIIHTERYLKISLLGFKLAKHNALNRLGIEAKLKDPNELDMISLEMQKTPYIPAKFCGNTDVDVKKYYLTVRSTINNLPKRPEKVCTNPIEAIAQTVPDSNFSGYRVMTASQVHLDELNVDGRVFKQGTKTLQFMLPRGTIVAVSQTNFEGNAFGHIRLNVTIPADICELFNNMTQWWNRNNGNFNRPIAPIFVENVNINGAHQTTAVVHIQSKSEEHRREAYQKHKTTRLPMIRRTDNQTMTPDMITIGDECLIHVRISVLERVRKGRQENGPIIIVSNMIIYETPIVETKPVAALPQAKRHGVPVKIKL